MMEHIRVHERLAFLHYCNYNKEKTSHLPSQGDQTYHHSIPTSCLNKSYPTQEKKKKRRKAGFHVNQTPCNASCTFLRESYAVCPGSETKNTMYIL